MKAPSSPRERHLLNVMSYMPKWLPFGILDKSQSINRSQYRDDGLVPTVCTGSSMFVMGLGRELNAPELAALFGHRDTPFGGQTDASVQRLLGNSMHLAEAASQKGLECLF